MNQMNSTYYYISDLSYDNDEIYKSIIRRMIGMLSDIYSDHFIFPNHEHEELAAKQVIEEIINDLINGQSIDLNDWFHSYKKYMKYTVKELLNSYIKEPSDPVKFTEKLKEMLKPFKDDEI